MWLVDDEPATPTSLKVEGNKLTVTCREPATIRLVTPHRNRSRLAATEAVFPLLPEDPWARIQVETGRTTVYLNPAYRYDGDPQARRRARVLPGRTWAVRGAGAVFLLGLGFLLLRRRDGRVANST